MERHVHTGGGFYGVSSPLQSEVVQLSHTFSTSQRTGTRKVDVAERDLAKDCRENKSLRKIKHIILLPLSSYKLPNSTWWPLRSPERGRLSSHASTFWGAVDGRGSFDTKVVEHPPLRQTSFQKHYMRLRWCALSCYFTAALFYVVFMV